MRNSGRFLPVPAPSPSSSTSFIICHRQPLYRVREFYERLDLGLLFDEPVTVADFNDDGFARTLDRLHASGELRRLVHSAALAAVRRLPFGIRSVHADTTSISLQGKYDGADSDRAFAEEHPDRPLLDITYGYSKDHRPELKQFVYGLVVSKEGLPLLAAVNDGNTSDKTWNLEVIREIQQSFLDPVELLYVADSALITRDNLDAMAGANLRLVSRLPETYKLAAELKERAWQDNQWRPIGRLAESSSGAVYRSRSYTATLYGREYRFIVVHSGSKNARSVKALAHRTEIWSAPPWRPRWPNCRRSGSTARRMRRRLGKRLSAGSAFATTGSRAK